MAINSLDAPGDKPNSKLQTSSNSYKTGAGYPPPCRLVKIDFATEGSICSSASKRVRKKTSESKSPYLSSDNVHLLSQVTEKTLFHKKGTEFHSSYPLAVNIYKASSDEFKSLKRANRKARKSVLTLPNDPAPMPQICTVSDMNDSEYFNQDEDRKKIKKRNPVPRNRLAKPKGRDYEYYDRDARYCSQMNINLDCSSTDMIQNYNDIGKRTGKCKPVGSQRVEEKPNPHDVWAVLRNINRFQFRPSPPMSEDSFITPKKKKGVKRRNNRKDMRLVETCRTEEFAYISSIEVDSRSPHSFSKSSSFDRITVIDKQDEFSKICKEFENRMVKTRNFDRGAGIKPHNRIQNNKAISNKRNMLKANTAIPKANSSKISAIEYNLKKQCNNSCGDTKLNKLQRNKDIPALEKIKDDFENSLNDKISENQFKSEINEADNVKQEFVYSGNSGSSKAAASNDVNNKGINKLGKEFSDDIQNPFNGITKVILSKGPVVPPVPKIPEPPKRKRQTSIFSSRPVAPKSTINTFIPKLTQADIKRRLARLKFPIIVLGKDQLSSTFEVPNAEPTQFDGLKDQVWPFMVRWEKGEGGKPDDTLKTKTESPQKKKCSPEILEYNKTQKMNRGFISLKQLNTKPIDDSKNKNTARADHKRISPADIHPQCQPKKTKPIRQFKEKMLKLLYKNSSIQSFDGEKNKTGGCSDAKSKPVGMITSNKVDASTDTRIIRTSPKDVPRNLIHSPVKTAKQESTTKQPWAKGRWASDFIDNVIRKIKNGVYYTHEPKLPNKKKCVQVLREVETQTIATTTEDNPIMHSISKIMIKKKPSTAIPGFDDNTLPALEIKTMNMNEISVKHRITNIMVHFDVTVPNESVINMKRSCSLIPLDVTESETKIFKCKRSIINAMLPAELCSILPKMMWNIIESNQVLALPPVPVDKSTSHLSTIAEITRCESPEPFKFSFFPHLRMTLKLQKIINGYYPNKVVPTCKHYLKYHTEYNKRLAEEMLPCLSRSHLFECETKATSDLKDRELKRTDFVSCSIAKTQLNTCMALQPYSAPEHKLSAAYTQFFRLINLHRLSYYVGEQIRSCSGVFNHFLDKNFTIKLSTTNTQGLQDTLSINFGRLMSSETTLENSLQDVDKSCNVTYKRELPAIQCNELKSSSSKNLQSQSLLSNKTKKRGFVKLYRKCKSTSHISAERSSTALSKITNLEEFFQALGAAKLSGVFDNIYSHKILSSLKEMKSWIADINPTQAFLVLLLINKKDTPNLVRFRPVLLQGIAVNRITRANELDMEIEVIEREHLNRLSQYEGVSYLPASMENQDNLLDELCWIAKTTASDYQRTFDESSEKLLKSLLEKRKKLNPSYLRVMARYVGLGLLKSPVKK